eukprot:gnl/Ergobibamus_cyprinoides/2536.p1 GENE.gnl/Ergobibamus_cyprinoides/2536~~gnl/Ergobibamus_cyprinoides/2536.p1  ORF type:complete len:131 (-),score=29.41 gnl/Ergobibamus_cyprinoides/2536:108-500(-)
MANSLASGLLLAGLGSGLGDLALNELLVDGADDADGDGLAHVTDGEAAERGVLGEGLDDHGLGGSHGDDGGVAGLDELGVLLLDGGSALVQLLVNGDELAGNVGSVAVACSQPRRLGRRTPDNTTAPHPS